ncbi:MAG: acyl-CoA dehydrogenase [Actinobacteria bacterium]|nr:acyl-CoA dehydrogenase [Actinomycetota bacterium]
MGLFALPDELEALRAAARRLAETEIASHAVDADRDATFPWASFEAYRDSGLVRAIYPEHLGGDGGGALAYAVLVEEVARVCGSSSLFVLISRLGVTPIVEHASDALAGAVVPRVAVGEWQASYCLSEPEAGSDVASMTTRAIRDGDHYVLDGRKSWITNAGISDVYTVFAKTDPAAGSRGISAFVVPRDTPGFTIGKLEHKMGMRGSPTGELVLEGAVVPADHLIGAEGQGFAYAMGALDTSRPIVGAQAVGLAQGALDAAARYVTQRRQFGRAIAEFQGLQFMLADMATQVEAARTLVYRACSMVDAGGPTVSKVSAMAKLFASDTAMRVTTDAVQVLGGAGYTTEFPVERMMRDAKVTQIYEGTNQIQRVVVGRRLLDEVTT